MQDHQRLTWNVLWVDTEPSLAVTIACDLSSTHALALSVQRELSGASQRLAQHDVDIIVMDPKPWGPDAVSRLRAASRAPLLVITHTPVLDDVLAYLDAGADGVVSRDTDMLQLGHALLDTLRGRAPLSSDVAALLLPLLRDRRVDNAAASIELTDRERNILGLLVHGHAYASIACALGIGLGTVQSHIKNLYRKLDVCTKAEAATLAIRHGLLRVEPERRRTRALT